MISDCCQVNEHQSLRSILKEVRHVWTLTKQVSNSVFFSEWNYSVTLSMKNS